MSAITASRRTRFGKYATAGVATLGAAAAALTLAPAAHAAPAKAPADASSVSAKQTQEIQKIADDAGNKYPNTLDGWIRQSLDIMKIKGIPGSYQGIYRNIIRESAGNPNAVNNWDINAQNGVPSKGLLQVIQPTFDTYHVNGTKDVLTDPVSNIVAACNYAAARYGSMDNVNSAY
ncbi:transglycosylase SLT domain-containing protein [Streptomyces sp. NPDC059740]|uniref:transglycosylase SLT domain-containing protein n=1 Tax=Streptomyces sp. NPDC059740 TaxID=3346926 RepID=UPI00365AEDBD